MSEPYDAQQIADWLTGGRAGVKVVQTYLSAHSGPVNVLVTHVPGGWQPVAILVDPELQEKLTEVTLPCPHH